jgi:hypothetical protein
MNKLKALLIGPLLLMVTHVHAMDWQYFDASFGSCGIPSECHDTRIESFLHALSSLGDDRIQTWTKPGALSTGVRDLAIDATSSWENIGVPGAAPDVILFGLSSDVFAGDFFTPLVSLQEVVIHYRNLDPSIEIWALQFPPVEAVHLQNPFLASHITQPAYDNFRATYANFAASMGVNMVHDAFYQWLPNNRPHPLIPGGDYHLDERSAMNAALNIYYTIRTN